MSNQHLLVDHYEWRPGSHVQVDVNVAAIEFDRLVRRDGAVIPKAVVEISRPDEAPLHPYFEWDDSAAAEHYREQQAAHAIRSFVVVYRKAYTNEVVKPIRALVRVKKGDSDSFVKPGLEQATEPLHYVPIRTVMAELELRDRYVRQALEALISWRDRYRDIADFARIFAEIEALQAQYQQAA